MKWQQLLFYLAALVALYLVRDHPFFWDTVQLGSKHAHFYYETHLSCLILPEEIDSGHPPVFGLSLALVWKLFGKNLAVSHFAMFPFVAGIIFFLFKLGEKIGGSRYAVWLPLLCFSDPVLASQALLVSPDIVLSCFFLMGLWSIWQRQHVWLSLAIAGLGLISLRGMMLGLGLYLFSVFIAEKQTWRTWLQRLPPFVPGGLLAFAYLLYHWQETGWTGYHENSTWAPSFERVGWKGFMKNVAVLGWRVMDFGRVFIWLALLLIVFSRRPLRSFFSRLGGPARLMALLCVLVFVSLVPTQLFYKGLLAHRYLLPFFLSLNLLLFCLFCQMRTEARPAWRFPVWMLVLCLAFAGGNLWVYPKKISMGWDSTLAHLPWYSLLNKARNYTEASGIGYIDTGTAFPNIGPRKYYELNGLEDGFKEKNLNSDCYILYSNIMNDFTDAEIDELEQRWLVVKKFSRGGVEVVIYKNPDARLCEN